MKIISKSKTSFFKFCLNYCLKIFFNNNLKNILNNVIKEIMNDLTDYKRYLLKLIFIIAIGCLVVLIAYYYLWAPHFEIAWNKSNSLPQKMFLIIKRMSVKRGNYVAFYPPQNQLYDRHKPFLKIIGGVEGDMVSKKDREFYVNNSDMGYVHLKSKSGITLYSGPTGVIGHDEYYVYTKNPRSYDSRYKSIGWVRKNSIEGRAFPIF